MRSTSCDQGFSSCQLRTYLHGSCVCIPDYVACRAQALHSNLNEWFWQCVCDLKLCILWIILSSQAIFWIGFFLIKQWYNFHSLHTDTTCGVHRFYPLLNFQRLLFFLFFLGDKGTFVLSCYCCFMILYFILTYDFTELLS